MKLWKYSGTFLTWTGIIHTIYAFFIGKDALGKMLGDGLADSVGEDYERGFAFWFLICGIVLILWGQTLQYYIKKEQKPAPAFWVIACCFLLWLVVYLFRFPVFGFSSRRLLL